MCMRVESTTKPPTARQSRTQKQKQQHRYAGGVVRTGSGSILALTKGHREAARTPRSSFCGVAGFVATSSSGYWPCRLISLADACTERAVESGRGYVSQTTEQPQLFSPLRFIFKSLKLSRTITCEHNRTHQHILKIAVPTGMIQQQHQQQQQRRQPPVLQVLHMILCLTATLTHKRTRIHLRVRGIQHFGGRNPGPLSLSPAVVDLKRRRLRRSHRCCCCFCFRQRRCGPRGRSRQILVIHGRHRATHSGVRYVGVLFCLFRS